jgi:hypothetical protein
MLVPFTKAMKRFRRRHRGLGFSRVGSHGMDSHERAKFDRIQKPSLRTSHSPPCAVVVGALITFGSGLFCGCAGTAARSDTRVDVPRTCATTLLRDASPLEPLAPATDTSARPSKIVVEAEIPFSRIARELEANVPRRVADERGRDIGLAGSLDTTVDRGPFVVSVSPSGDALVVKTTLHAQARACTSQRGCYASCSPEAVATTTVPLALSEGFAIAKPHLMVTLVRGCRISALGGLLQVDITPTIVAELGPHVRRVEQEMARRLPDLRPELAVRWAMLAKPRELPLGAGCVTLHPSGVTQGPSRGTADAVRLRFSLTASPELRPRCDEPAPLFRSLLPALAHDPAMPEEDELDVRVRLPLSTFATATSVPRPMALGSVRSIPKAATVRADGTGIALDLTLMGEVCGDVRSHATIAWKDDAHALGYASTGFSKGARARLEQAGVPADALVNALETNVRVSPKLTPDSLKSALPLLISALSAPDIELSATVSSSRPGNVRPDAEDILASMRVTGKLEARLTR